MKPVTLAIWISSSILLVFLFSLAVYKVFFSNSVTEGTDEEYADFTIVETGVTPYSENNDVVPIQKLFEGRSYSANEQAVLAGVYDDVYLVMECTENGSPENVLMMTARNSEEAGRTDFAAAKRLIRNWEPTMANDLVDVLYPDAASYTTIDVSGFETYPFNSNHVVATEYRREQVYFGITRTELYYAWTLNYVFFARSSNCLETTMAAVYHLD